MTSKIMFRSTCLPEFSFLKTNNMRYFSFIMVLALAFAFQNCSNNADPITQENDVNDNGAVALSVKQNITPAFSDFDVMPQTLTVKGNDAQTLHLSSGSSIDVPEAAFVDEKGTPITGDVDIAFREFHNAAEIIASGIPMKVFSKNGKEEWMQTAGMYEINGSQNGQPVFVAPGKSLNVNLVSEVDGEYDFWKYNDGAGNWDNLGVSTPQPNPNAVKQEGKVNVGTPPNAPIAFNENTPPIDLDVNLKNFPELAEKKGIVWQYAGKDKKKDPANNPGLFQTNWDDIELTANADGQTYTLTLSNDDEKVTLPVVPTLKGKNLEQALADYQLRLDSYKKKLASAQDMMAFRENQSAFIRSFQVQGFGVYNYDILMKTGNSIPILANFDFGTDIPANLRQEIMVFLIAADGRMVVKFPPSDWAKMRIDPDLNNAFVAILPGNKLAVLSKEEVKKQLPIIKESVGQEFVFRMNVQEQEVRTVEEVEGRLAAL